MLTVAHALTHRGDADRRRRRHRRPGAPVHGPDRPRPQIIEAIASSGAFVVACVVLDASMMGITGSALADDPRVAGKLSAEWDATLRSSFNHYPQGRLEDVLATVRALDAAGVDLLIGTDVSQPLPFLGGLAHGASVHQELQYFVDAGLAAREGAERGDSCGGTPLRSHRSRAPSPWVSAPTCSSSTATRRPTISDTLNIRDVWRRGTRLPTA